MTNKEANRRSKVSMVKQIAKFNGCRVCGKTPLNPSKLHFHHLDPESKVDRPAQIRGLGALLEELLKCVVVCNKCHKAIEAGTLFVADHKRLTAEELEAIAGYVNFDWEAPRLEDIPF